MPTTYLTPGVYVEEIPAAQKPLEGVSTSVAAFVGLAPGGPVNTPMRIANWSQFARTFGDAGNPEAGPFMEGAYLAHAVYGFFQNGGTLCWVIRIGADGDSAAPPVRAALPAAGDTSVETLNAVARPGIEGPVTVELTEEESGEPADEQKPEDKTYRLVVVAGDQKEEYEGLTIKGRSNLRTKVNAASKLIKLEETGASLPEALRAPKPGKYTLAAAAPDKSDLSSGDFEGDPARRQGMGGLVAIDEVSIVCMPDAVNLLNGNDVLFRDAQGKLISHCESLGDRMCILDPPPNLLPQEILEWRKDTAGYDSKMATLYWPWIEVVDPLSKRPIMVPPSGHVAGLWARTDDTRGVHKAPANEVVMGATSLGFQLTSVEQGELNRLGINCIRAFSGRGIRVWGARTLSSDPEWRYINVRRLFNFVSQTLMEGTQWSVFEPNDERLWLKLRASVSNFLTNLWRGGALFGTSPEQAFFVKCDAETNPPEDHELGRLDRADADLA
ncbi:MAG TPA: phage tail sheath subtilisin-like domain-containing protein, partial [Solirubrobacteraceae bacterium]|nr:phage tail sheath subtilisin-like domain-containing protein [Solirubrobacteraceae bacterium]